jgi:hypothetical protein
MEANGGSSSDDDEELEVEVLKAEATDVEVPRHAAVQGTA